MRGRNGGERGRTKGKRIATKQRKFFFYLILLITGVGNGFLQPESGVNQIHSTAATFSPHFQV